MGDIRKATDLKDELFVPVSLLRDVRMASVDSDKNSAVKLVSPMGFTEEMPRQVTMAKYRRLDGRKVKMASWKEGSQYLVVQGQNVLWYAAYIPVGERVGVVYPDKTGRVANKVAHRRGDFVVCPSTPSKSPDKSRLYIISNDWFHRMFRFTPEAVEVAKNILAIQQESVGAQTDSSVGMGRTREETPSRPRASSPTAGRSRRRAADVSYPDIASLGAQHEDTVELPHRPMDTDTEPVRAEVSATSVAARQRSQKNGRPQVILKRTIIGSSYVEFIIPSDGTTVEVEKNPDKLREYLETHDAAVAKAMARLSDAAGKFVGVQLIYPDGSGSADVSLPEVARLAQLGLIYNLGFRIREGGKGVLHGRNGTKLAELPMEHASFTAGL